MDNQAVFSSNISQKATVSSVFCKHRADQAGICLCLTASQTRASSSLLLWNIRLKPQQNLCKSITFCGPAPSPSKLAGIWLPTFIRNMPPLQQPFPPLHSKGIAGCYNSIVPGWKLPSSITSKHFSGICFLAQLNNFFPPFLELAEIKRPQWHCWELQLVLCTKAVCIHM